MDYVMVPVPEELAPKVLRYISWRGHPLLESQGAGDDEATPDSAPASDSAGGDDRLARAFARVDGQSRTLLTITATAALGHELLTVAEAAQRAGLSEREAIGVIIEFNNLVATAGGPPVTVLVADADGAEGAAFSWDLRVVVLGEPVARAIADLASTE